MQSVSSIFSPPSAVLVATMALLAYIGFQDSRTFRIQNTSIALLAALFFVYAVISGLWGELAWNAVFAALMFAVLLIPYHFGAIGGGDIKLLAIAFLWTGIHYALMYALLLLGFGVLVLISVTLKFVDAPIEDGRARVAYGPAISAALIVTLVLSYLSASLATP
jgi:prepilin peptidase CpaA